MIADPYAAFNAGVTRARAEYVAHPSAFADPTLCPNCLHPRVRRNCDLCRAAERMRAHRAKRKTT